MTSDRHASNRFTPISLPDGRTATIPTDIDIAFYDRSTHQLTAQQCQATAYIPWHDKYLQHVPSQYRQFFLDTLPYMQNRTTNVHTALSVAQLPHLFAQTKGPIDQPAIYLAVILHDIGWSKVSLHGIADSLSYSGLTLSEAAQLPKEQHILIGVTLAKELLEHYHFKDLTLSDAQIQHVIQMIRRHDHDMPWEAGKHSSISLETLLVCDADRLWSYTHENFWLDTIRKNTSPEQYISRIEEAVETYFFTQQGKNRARTLLAERQQEVSSYLASSIAQGVRSS